MARIKRVREDKESIKLEEAAEALKSATGSLRALLALNKIKPPRSYDSSKAEAIIRLGRATVSAYWERPKPKGDEEPTLDVSGRISVSVDISCQSCQVSAWFHVEALSDSALGSNGQKVMSHNTTLDFVGGRVKPFRLGTEFASILGAISRGEEVGIKK